jgi:hypothetical protein
MTFKSLIATIQAIDSTHYKHNATYYDIDMCNIIGNVLQIDLLETQYNYIVNNHIDCIYIDLQVIESNNHPMAVSILNLILTIE